MTASDDGDGYGADGVETRESSLPFETTLERLREVIERRGLRVFDVIDHQAAAVDVGLTLRPTRVIVFGSPNAGTPLMVAYPLLALELPLRILVWEADDGRARVSHLAADALAGQFRIDATMIGPLAAPAAIVSDALDGG
jgi:uncharacterized protein (DUF302 family)